MHTAHGRLVGEGPKAKDGSAQWLFEDGCVAKVCRCCDVAHLTDKDGNYVGVVPRGEWRIIFNRLLGVK